MNIILPGATLGVLGGGQLGRMFCVAARTMGYKLIVYDPDPKSPAGRIADQHIQAEYSDESALQRLADLCDAVTTEFENVPAESLRLIAGITEVHPSADALLIAQNRVTEKSFARDAGLNPALFFHIESTDDLETAAKEIGFPAILKSATLGYDGKGQAVVGSYEELVASYSEIGTSECILEKMIDLELEISAIVCRNKNGDTAAFPVAENQHRDGILHMSIVPARVEDAIVEQAKQQAIKLADALDYVGILAVEFFISKEGELLFNEMAPRPHNSGHYTKDACVTSQYEQQVRMMCGMVPGDVRLLTPVVMVNLLGDLWDPNWEELLQHPGIKLHLYGKEDPRPGRKMGHFNAIDEDLDRAIEIAAEVFSRLS